MTQPPPDTLPMTEERLREIEERAAKAAPGPWEAPLKDLGEVASFQAIDFYFDHSYEAYPPLGESGPVFVAASAEIADFCAHAREDVPSLIGEIRRLQQIVGKLPVTRDGVTIVPGMEIWHNAISGVECWTVHSVAYNPLLQDADKLIVRLLGADGECTARGWQIYSSRDAASIASSAGESTGEGHERE